MDYLAKIKLLCMVFPCLKGVEGNPCLCSISRVVCFSCYSRQQEDLQELSNTFSQKLSSSSSVFHNCGKKQSLNRVPENMRII